MQRKCEERARLQTIHKEKTVEYKSELHAAPTTTSTACIYSPVIASSAFRRFTPEISCCRITFPGSPSASTALLSGAAGLFIIANEGAAFVPASPKLSLHACCCTGSERTLSMPRSELWAKVCNTLKAFLDVSHVRLHQEISTGLHKW